MRRAGKRREKRERESVRSGSEERRERVCKERESVCEERESLKKERVRSGENEEREEWE